MSMKQKKSTSQELKKQDMAKHISDELGLSLKTATAAVDLIFAEIKSALVRGDTVQIYQIGKFLRVLRQARKGVNPATGQYIDIPESFTVAFKVSSALK